MNEESLKFQNFVFKPGLNVTVRNGAKWYDRGPGPIQLSNHDGSKTKPGYITGVTNVPFTVVQYIDLKNEHDSACRTYKKLLKVMQDIYPGFKETDYVTVVRFKVMEEN